MHSIVQPHSWVAIKLPTGNLRILQVTPNTTISLGKYGTFPSNLIIQRPFHLTYELEDRRENESFNRLRIVPASELYQDVLTESSNTTDTQSTPVPDQDDDTAAGTGGSAAAEPTNVEFSLVDPESGAVVAKTNRVDIDAAVAATQTLTMEEIEALKKHGTNAGQDLIAKLMLSHTAIDQKTEYSLAKYKLLKTKKYIRRFSVLPLDVPLLNHWLLEEKDPSKILDMREEMIGLLGCWANVHFGGEESCEGQEVAVDGVDAEEQAKKTLEDASGRWLAIDDTGGLLVAAMAERMGVLFSPEATEGPQPKTDKKPAKPRPAGEEKEQAQVTESVATENNPSATAEQSEPTSAPEHAQTQPAEEQQVSKATAPKRTFSDLQIPYSQNNTLTVIHANSQPNLSFLRYFDYDAANPPQAHQHPLARHLLTLTWLQLLDPQADTTYAAELATATPEELRSWKANRRGNYHRKRRRWARLRHIVDTTRQGGFSGLVVASTMDPVSIMRHTVPLLAGGAPVAIYSQSVEPLNALMDCYSIARRAAWVQTPPAELEGKSAEELERWQGNDEFPLNPTLLLGASLQTSRVRKWQVLPNRTHPLMTSRGGAEGYVFTAFRVKPAEGKVEARGKARSKKRKVDEV
ncbi:Gcd10p family-domain-containing protein [Microdochium trichocladiopsis]|uniref:tRNA (adenine(58)-N(1))-methyltransferase non-catalytic subunit TRM6 n=1 Tax=Microdochium trichocladiopsis TaxID=1682393 RepID=A0A9P9BVT7_9PEZI|nr:Gcd10p family-domain-containing protein [Microdochium trichocladiopsis]KAH7040633.1 Gcd10p family-domain-containing protein [Microdochium trichocladiopsis]